jgi:hypothetical protein
LISLVFPSSALSLRLPARTNDQERNAAKHSRAGSPGLDRVLFLGGERYAADLHHFATGGEGSAADKEKRTGGDEYESGNQGQAHGGLHFVYVTAGW